MEVSVSGQAIPCSRQGGWAVSGRSGTAVLRHLPHLSGHKNRPGRGPGRGRLRTGGFATARTLLHCHATPPSAYARFPSDSEQPLRASPAYHGYSSLQSNRAAPGASHFFIVTPRLLTTPGFPPTQGKPGRALPALGFALRSGPSGLFATARTLLHCHATPPSAYARFPSDSEQPLRASPAYHGYSSLQSNRAAPGASHFF